MIDLTGIPNQPGCYLFKDNAGIILYIGKAKELKKRVSSYFQKKGLDPKTENLVKNISDIDFILTDNEIEALILENNLIKKHKPRYNINLKDSKRYAYLMLTKEKFPRLLLARKIDGIGEYFGPFVSAAERDYVAVCLKKNFRLRTCSKFPKRPCLRFHIRLCDAPCIGSISEGEYRTKLDVVRSYLKGNSKELIKDLNKEMENQSSKQNYENALELRNQAAALVYLSEKQNMERIKKYDEDIVNYIIIKDKVHLELFNVRKGILHNKQDFEFLYKKGFLDEFLLQYYDSNKIPGELILPTDVDPALVNWLVKKAGKKVKAIVPVKGEKKQLLDLVKKNIEKSFLGFVKSLQDLKVKLKLQDNPAVIECFDISHISGSSMAASMVQFREGSPDKTNYRRFRIKSVSGVNDTAAIAEVVKRRYSRLKSEGRIMPDLVVIDGGVGQLNAALNELEKLNVRIPVIAIVKKLEHIYVPGMSIPIVLNKKSPTLQLLQRIRDEAHRFAIKYNRLLRKKELIK